MTKLARVCPSDGSGWLTVQCESGAECEAGECVKPPVLCSILQDTCMGNVAYRCLPNGSGFEMVTCPAGTTCEGRGNCKGACIGGESICLDTGTIATCKADGSGYTTTTCDVVNLSLCVQVANVPHSFAECRPAVWAVGLDER